MKKLFIFPALIGLAVSVFLILKSPMAILFSPAGNGSPVDVTVDLKEFKVNMSRTQLPANTPIRLNIINQGAVQHEVVLEHAGDVDKAIDLGNNETAEADDIGSGATTSVVWEITQPGKYQLACHVPGHFQGGMLQRFDVLPTDFGGLASYSSAWLAGGGAALLLGLLFSGFLFRRSSGGMAA